jgi:hypothetical protein
MKHAVATSLAVNAANAAYTADTYNTIGYAWYRMIVVNSNPNKSYAKDINEAVVITSAVGAPGQLKACTLSSSTALVAAIAYDATPWVATGTLTYEADWSADKKTWA